MKGKTLAYLLILFSLGMAGIVLSNAQDMTPIEIDKTQLGLQYKIDGVWVNQVTGTITEVNSTCIEVEWFRYDEVTPIRTGVVSTKLADSYEIELRVYTVYYNDTDLHKTYCEFIVYWINDGVILDIDNDAGELIIRDVSGRKRTILDVQRVRKYEYIVGDVIWNE